MVSGATGGEFGFDSDMCTELTGVLIARWLALLSTPTVASVDIYVSTWAVALYF